MTSLAESLIVWVLASVVLIYASATFLFAGSGPGFESVVFGISLGLNLALSWALYRGRTSL